MGEFEKGRNQDKFGQGEKSDKSAFQQLGDDKGEGGQQDIRTDSIETSQAKPELTGAEGGQDYGKQQGSQEFGQGKPQQGEKLGQDQGRQEAGGKFEQDDKQGRF